MKWAPAVRRSRAREMRSSPRPRAAASPGARRAAGGQTAAGLVSPTGHRLGGRRADWCYIEEDCRDQRRIGAEIDEPVSASGLELCGESARTEELVRTARADCGRGYRRRPSAGELAVDGATVRNDCRTERRRRWEIDQITSVDRDGKQYVETELGREH